jgi:hypothetical protein
MAQKITNRICLLTIFFLVTNVALSKHYNSEENINDKLGSVLTSSPTINFMGPTFVASDGIVSRNACHLSSTIFVLQTSSVTTGSTISHIWQTRIYPSGTWVDVPTATDPSFFVLTNYQDTVEIRKKINETGIGTYFSNILRLNILKPINAGTIQPLTQTIVAPSTSVVPITFSTLPSGANGRFNLFWEYTNDTTAGGSWTTATPINNVLPQNINPYTPPTALLNQTRFYRASFYYNSDVSGICPSNYYQSSNIVKIEVIPCASTSLNGGTIRNVVDPYPYPYGCNVMLIVNQTYPSGGGTSYSYLWERQLSGSTNWLPAPTTTLWQNNQPDYESSIPTDGTKYRRRVTDNCGNVAYSNEITYSYVTYYAPYGGNIKEDQTITSGGLPAQLVNHQFPIYYTDIVWQMKTTPSGSWADIPASNNLNYQPPTLTQTTYYRRKVTNNNCSRVAHDFSNVVTITVNPVATPLLGGSINYSHPNSNVCAGSTLQVINNVTTASGGYGVLTYEWQYKREADISWTSIPNSNSLNFTPTSITESTLYRRKVTDDNGNIAYSNTVSLSVLTVSVPLRGGLIGSDIFICTEIANSNFTDVVTPCGGYGNLQFEWQVERENNVFVPLPNSNSPSYNLSPVSGTWKIRRKVIDECNNTAYSNTLTIHKIDLPDQITITPTKQTFCLTNTSELMKEIFIIPTSIVNSNNTNLSYQWQKSDKVNGTFIDIPNATFSRYTPRIEPANMYYRVKVTHKQCNEILYSPIAVVVVTENCILSAKD